MQALAAGRTVALAVTAPPVRFPLGISDFRTLRDEGYQYVDKTPFIEAVLDAGAQVLLIPRPRRFGKTLNLSMLRYFLERSPEDRSGLFEGLAIASSESARRHAGRYPVIFMTFKDVKPRSWEDCFAGIAIVIAKAYQDHRALLDDGHLAREEATLFSAILAQEATHSTLTNALNLLSRILARHHGEKVVILIDEYDSPIHAGYTNRYYDDVIAFFRDFLSAGLKDNPHLFKGVLTGILRVARESMFSGLNNVDVHGLLRPKLAPYFGFTEPEVRALVLAAGRPDLMDGVRSFYNGYLFGGIPIYNPWSVLAFLDRGDDQLLPHWVDTSSNELVREILLTGPGGVKAELETLLSGGTLDKRIDENIVLRDIAGRSDAVWSFLLFTGYLKAAAVRVVDCEQWATLAVPNVEIGLALRRMAHDWIEGQAGGSDSLERLLAALLRGDGPTLERQLSRIALVNVSYFDSAFPEPERFYHGLVVGLLAGLGSRYEVRSNRESGLGRCDVLVLPRTPGQPGVVLELKTADVTTGETPERALRAALAQIRDRDYAAELRERGASPIHQIAAVFDGKRAWVRVAAAKPEKPSPAKSPRAGAAKAKVDPKRAVKKASSGASTKKVRPPRTSIG